MKRLAIAAVPIGLLFLYIAVSNPSGASDGRKEVTSAGVWTCAAPLPTARSEVAAAALDGKIYVAGGMNRWGRSAAFEALDTTTNRWERLPQLPMPLHHVGIATAGGRIYIAGGYNDFTLSHPLRSAWVYHPQMRAWSRIADMPGIRAEHAMISISDKLYIIGGWGDAQTAIWVYDPTSNSWSTLPTLLPTARVHLSVVFGHGKIYVLGGRWTGGNVDVVEAYDLASGVWSRLHALPSGRSGFAAAWLDGRIHVFGGESLTDSTTMSDHAVYDTASDSWTRAESHVRSRHGVASAVVGNRWYIIGGGRRAGLRTPWSATAAVDVFQPKPR